MKKNIFFLALSSCIIANAQIYQWAKGIGQPVLGNLPNNARCVTTDAVGNVYTTGCFKGANVDFNPGMTPNNLSSSTSNVFFAKYSPSGSCTWAKGILGGLSGIGQSIASDASGNIYITGYFSGTSVDFDPGAGSALLSGANGDIFIAKYDNNGNYIWAGALGGPSSDLGMGLSLDPSGNVYITGRFNSSNADFDPGPGVANLSTAGNFDIFFAKYDTNGNYLWAKTVGSTGSDISNAISTDAAGNVYITGNFQGTAVDFDPGSGVATLSALAFDIYFAKYDANGNYLWARSVPGSSNGAGQSIKADAAGNFWITGNFQGQSVDFDPGPATATLNAGPASGMFFASYSSGGNYVWAKCVPNSGAYSIARSFSGKIHIVGGFSASTDFDPGPGVAVLNSGGGGDIFLAKYDAAGNYIWAKPITPATSSYGNSIACDGTGNVFIAGAFLATNMDFDPGPGTATLSSQGGDFMYLAKYGYCSTPANNPLTICPGGSYAINGHTYTAAGMYNDTLYTAFGCDSLVLTQLTVSGQQPPVTVSSSSALCAGVSNSLIAAGAVSYTWSTGAQTQGIAVTPTVMMQYVVSGTGPGGCTASATIGALPVPNLSISAKPTVCKGQVLTMTVSGANSYTWNSGAQTQVISVTPNSSAIYTVSGSFTTGCRSQQTVNVIVSNCLSTESHSGNNLVLSVYPNPAKTELFYTLNSSGLHRYALVDFNGNVIAEGEQRGNKIKLDLSAYQPGIYNLTISIGKLSNSKRFLIE